MEISILHGLNKSTITIRKFRNYIDILGPPEMNFEKCRRLEDGILKDTRNMTANFCLYKYMTF